MQMCNTNMNPKDGYYLYIILQFVLINHTYPIGNCKVFKFQPFVFNASDNR